MITDTHAQAENSIMEPRVHTIPDHKASYPHARPLEGACAHCQYRRSRIESAHGHMIISRSIDHVKRSQLGSATSYIEW